MHLIRLLTISAMLFGFAMPHSAFAPAQDTFASQATIKLIWPDEDHVRRPGKYLLEGSFTIHDPAVIFRGAGFIINNTPYYAAIHEGSKFGLNVNLKPGRYLIEAFIVDTRGTMHPGEAHTLWIKASAVEEKEKKPRPPDKGDTSGVPPPSLHPAFKGEGLQLYIEFEAPVRGQAWGRHISFPPKETKVKLEPKFNWSGNSFEAFLYYTKPDSDLWVEERKAIAKTRWEIRYRIFGRVSPDHKLLEGVTMEYKAELRRDDDYLWEYIEAHFALTNVPGQGSITGSNNPLAYAPPTYTLRYALNAPGIQSLDNVLELSYRRGFPAYPETEYSVSHATITRVQFTFSGW